MASIQSLLNPEPPNDSRQESQLQDNSPSSDGSQGTNCGRSRGRPSSSGVTSQQPQPQQLRTRKSRAPKDVPIFVRGSIRGELRYPPCEDRDEKLAEEHRRFQLYPMGEIAEYPRHIPYSSDKKSFMRRTGRDYFEVFQYTFQIPGKDKGWTIMWDYNIGLVRITHLFKCNEYPKTTPAKVLNANPGLREISHSITGGALAAQGYWMPYEAAKALAATFCWRIRYALTPLFGTDFPDMCLSPQQSGFGQMLIDACVIEQAARNAQRYRMLELQSKANNKSGMTLAPESSFKSSPSSVSSSVPKSRGRGRPRSSSALTRKAESVNASSDHQGARRTDDDDDSEESSCPSHRLLTGTVSPSQRGSSSFTPINGAPPLPSSLNRAHEHAGVKTDDHYNSSLSPSSTPPPKSRKRPFLPSPSKILAAVSGSRRRRILPSKCRHSPLDNDSDDEYDSSNAEKSSRSRHYRHRRAAKDNSSVSATLSDTTDSDLSSASFSSSYLSSFTEEDDNDESEGEEDPHSRKQRHTSLSQSPSSSPSSSSSLSPSRNVAARRLTREVKAAQALLSLQLQGGGEANSNSSNDRRDFMKLSRFSRPERVRAAGVIDEDETRARKRLRRASA